MLVPHLLGTVVEVRAGGVSPPLAPELEQVAIDEIRRLESVFNIFDQASDITQLRAIGTTPVAELAQVLELASRWQQRSLGAFNPYIDVVRMMWEEAEATQELPSLQALADAASEIRTDAPIPHLNLNAIAKGWIVDRALDRVFAMAHPPPSCWVSIGGDIAHRGAGSVVVGIEDPSRPFDNVAPRQRVQLSNQALATSGGARRYWTIDGKRFSHVLDPRSGRPVDHISSATVIADDAATADVLATAATVLQTSETIELIDAIPNTSCLLVDSNQQIHSSQSWADPSG